MFFDPRRYDLAKVGRYKFNKKLHFNKRIVGHKLADDVVEGSTGEILAEASYPNFDLNKPRDLSAIYSTEDWNAKTEDEQLDAMNELWRNFCVSDAFEPGSTIKPFTVATGLDTGAIKGDEPMCVEDICM